ncbi:MAG: hypothetical protein J0I41_14435 [Filimonas sp.]|nr:hypothetical protein [Filimonas sp.]
MKSTLLLILCITLFLPGCKNHQVEPDTITIKPFILTEDASIIGDWKLCSISYGDGTMLTFNVCPSVTFSTNGQGFAPPNKQAAFTWSLQNHVLYISPSYEYSPFTKGKYAIYFIKQEYAIPQSMELTNEAKTTYYLSRETNGFPSKM